LQPAPVIYREEVTAILFTPTDISVKLSQIIDLLKEEDGEEEEEGPRHLSCGRDGARMRSASSV
jgi:hypothetical protein